MPWEYTKTNSFSENKYKQNVFCYEDQRLKITKSGGKSSNAPMAVKPIRCIATTWPRTVTQSTHTHTWEASHSRVQTVSVHTNDQQISNRCPAENICSAREGEWHIIWVPSQSQAEASCPRSIALKMTTQRREGTGWCAPGTPNGMSILKHLIISSAFNLFP